MAERAQDAALAANLQKPGAGVPALHGFIMRYLVGPVITKRANWEKDNATFASVNAKILKLAEGLTDDEMTTRVLVPPQFGLEDSSRYWSPAMVLEHMVIVGPGIKNIAIMLSQGIVPDFKVETSRVKPKGQGTPQDALKNFREFSANAMGEFERGMKDRDSKSTLLHPWFGPFTARQWHWLMAGHCVIHLAQMQAIVERLRPAQ